MAQVTVIIAIGCNSLQSLWNGLQKISSVFGGHLIQWNFSSAKGRVFWKAKIQWAICFPYFSHYTQQIPTAHHRRKIKNEFMLSNTLGVWHSGRLQNAHHWTPPWASAHFKNMTPLGSYTPNLIVKSHGPEPLISYLLCFVLIRWGASNFNFVFLAISQFDWPITQKI